MNKMATKVGVFVAAGIILSFILIFAVGNKENFFSPQIELRAQFRKVDGLDRGAMVRFAGIVVGSVREVNFGSGLSDIHVFLGVNRSVAKRIRKDATASIRTMGVLGDKYLLIEGGTESHPPVREGDFLNGIDPSDFRTDTVMENVTGITKNLEKFLGAANRDGRSDRMFEALTQTMEQSAAALQSLQRTLKDLETAKNDINFTTKNIKSISQKIDQGQGTLGLLVNDPSLFDDLKSLVGGAERNKILKFFIRNQIKKSNEKAAPKEAQ